MGSISTWSRDPDGPPYPGIPPIGKRTLNGLIWAREKSDFYCIPTSNTTWSKSMIDEFEDRTEKDKTYNGKNGESDLQDPRILLPWSSPELKDPPDSPRTPSTCLSEEEKEDDPPLQEHITEGCFPDIILVSDVSSKIQGTPKPEEEDHRTKLYIRVYPEPHRDMDDIPPAFLDAVRAGSLDLDDATTELKSDLRVARMEFSGPLGTGHHSIVYRCSIRLPESNRPYSVAVKAASQGFNATRMLNHEAQTYCAFPKHLMEDWSGYNYLEQAVCSNRIVPVHAVVPKFYGYYVPMTENAEKVVVDEGSMFRPILIIEDCGTPLDRHTLKREQKNEILSLTHRLHLAGFTQNSLFPRNILVQPGPLTDDPAVRLGDTPSFRIIDFGRAMRWDEDSQSTSGGCCRMIFDWGVIDEIMDATKLVSS